MSNSEAKLTIRHDPSSEQDYPLGKGSITIGREAFNDIVIFDPEASRRHAQISYREDRYILEDLGSTNGTFVNGRRVTVPTPLHNADVIEIGETSRIVFSSTVDQFGETVLKADPLPGMDKTVADPSMPDWGADLATPEPLVDDQLAGVDPYDLEIENAYGPDASPIDAEESLVAPSEGGKQDRRRYIIGCGCLFLVVVFGCAATAFLLDALAADALYCGPAQPLFDLFDVSCP